MPQSDKTLLIRTDFSNDKVWEDVRSLASKPGPDFQEALGLISDAQEAASDPLDEIETNLDIVDDRDFDGATVEELLKGLGDDGHQAVLIVVDQAAIHDPEHPVLIVDLLTERGRTFRALPSCVFEIESNLSIGNMDWEEFVNGVDDTGVYRGFGGL